MQRSPLGKGTFARVLLSNCHRSDSAGRTHETRQPGRNWVPDDDIVASLGGSGAVLDPIYHPKGDDTLG